MEKVRPWCGQPSDRERLNNRIEANTKRKIPNRHKHTKTKSKPNHHASLRTVYMCVCVFIIVHNCRTQHSMQHF